MSEFLNRTDLKQSLDIRYSINDEIYLLQKYLPIRISFDSKGYVIGENFSSKEILPLLKGSIFSEDINGCHFLGFDVPFFDDQTFQSCLSNHDVKTVKFKLPSVVDSNYLLSWNACLVPIIHDGFFQELEMTAILVDEADLLNSTLSLKVSDYEINQRQMLLADSGSWELDLLTNEFKSSPSLNRFMALDSELLTFDDFLAKVHCDDQVLVENQMNTMLKDGAPYLNLIRVYSDVKEIKVFESRVWAIKGSGGGMIKVRGSLQDLSSYQGVRSDIHLDESQRLLNLIIEHGPGMTFQVERYPDGYVNYLYVGHECEKLLYVTQDDIFNDALLPIKLIHPDDRSDVIRKIEDSAKKLHSFDFISRFIINDSIKWIHGRSIPHKKDDGRIIWDGMLCDITEQKNLKLDLDNKITELETYKKIVDSSQKISKMGSFVFLVSDQCFQISNGYCEILYLEHNLISFHEYIHTFVHDQDRSYVESKFKEFLEFDNVTEQQLQFNYRIKCQDTGNIKFLKKDIVFYYENNQCIRCIGTVLDVTDAHQLEADLQEKYQQLEFLYKNLPGMVARCELLLDGNLRYTFVSDGCREIFGVEAQEILDDASLIIKLMHPDDSVKFIDSVKASAVDMTLFDIVFRIIVDNKIKTLHGKALPTKKDDGRVAWDGVLLDISLQKQLEEDVQALEKEKEKERAANKMKTEFLCDISHELRTPLNAINGFSEMLLDGFVGDLNQKQRQYIDEINRGGEYLLKLINTIIDITIIEKDHVTLQFSRVNGVEFMEDLKNSLMPILLAKQLKLTINSSSDDIVFSTDLVKLQQIFTNIIQNSIRHSFENGEIIINISSNLNRVIFEIIDFGEGISASKLSQLFNAVYIKKHQMEKLINHGESSGLGLSITKQLVELMNGDIEISSDGKDKGATVSVSLPV